MGDRESGDEVEQQEARANVPPEDSSTRSRPGEGARWFETTIFSSAKLTRFSGGASAFAAASVVSAFHPVV